jgi:histidine triad (HIT) family protein
MIDEKDCVFCKLLKGEMEVSFVYQDHLCSALMDIQPVNAGYVLVIPNRHAAYLAELHAAEGEHIFGAAQRLSAAIRRSGVRCEGINFFLADGEAAMQEVLHVHRHVFPRYTGDGFGLKLAPKYYQKPERSELSRVAEGIREAIKAG